MVTYNVALHPPSLNDLLLRPQIDDLVGIVIAGRDLSTNGNVVFTASERATDYLITVQLTKSESDEEQLLVLLGKVADTLKYAYRVDDRYWNRRAGNRENIWNVWQRPAPWFAWTTAP